MIIEVFDGSTWRSVIGEIYDGASWIPFTAERLLVTLDGVAELLIPGESLVAPQPNVQNGDQTTIDYLWSGTDIVYDDATLERPTMSFPVAGTHIAMLEVTDARGTTATAAFEVTVVASATQTQQILYGEVA